MFWKKGSPDELSAFLFRKTSYSAHLFTGNLSARCIWKALHVCLCKIYKAKQTNVLIEPDLRWQKKRQVFQIIVIESNQFISYLFIMSGVQILETFLALLWPNENQVAQQKFKLFKTRPIHLWK